MPIFRVPSWIQLLFPQSYWRGDAKSKIVHLTFDDGPHSSVTPWVLQQLDAFDFKAHFFVVGQNAEKHPELIARILELGHGLGNHTHTHRNGWKTALSPYLEDVRQCQAQLPQGKLWFRPPYGKIRPAQSRQLRAKGYRIAMWDVLSMDFDPSRSSQQLLQKLKSLTRPGSVIVFHDSLKAEPQLKAILPSYLQWLAACGYQSRPLPSEP